MCLIVKTAYHLAHKPLIAERDITCYKILFTYEESGNKKYITPYRSTEVLSNTLIADRFQINISSYYKRVDLGIHSFQTYYKALSERDYLNTSLPLFPKLDKYVVKKAYIPKGTKYWIGENEEFCSERIVFTEK